jgi:hypothetical protein
MSPSENTGGLRLDEDDAVQVIGHDNRGIERDSWELLGNCVPDLTDHPTDRVGMHQAIANLTEPADTVLRGGDDVIERGCPIVVPSQSRRFTAAIRINCGHRVLLESLLYSVRVDCASFLMLHGGYRAQSRRSSYGSTPCCPLFRERGRSWRSPVRGPWLRDLAIVHGLRVPQVLVDRGSHLIDDGWPWLDLLSDAFLPGEGRLSVIRLPPVRCARVVPRFQRRVPGRHPLATSRVVTASPASSPCD